TPDRGDDPRAEEEVGPRLLVHQQVEVAAPVALLDVRQAVERVGQRHADLREELELPDRERRLTAPRLRRDAGDADYVAEIEIDSAELVGPYEELDAPAPVDEVEEHELAEVAPRHDPAGEAARFLR